MNDIVSDNRHVEPGGSSSAVSVRCVSPPDWVQRLELSVRSPPPGDAYVDNGLCRLLYDSQISLRNIGFANHLRTVQRIVSRTGAENAAHIAVEFDPSHQRVEVHSIRVLRGESYIDHANADSFQVLRRETKLERLALDGRLTATRLIPDLRVDDLLDVSITIYSTNPILGGKYAGWVTFNALAPWFEVRQRFVRPVEREVFEKNFNNPPDGARVMTHGTIESTWSLATQTRLEAEELTPPWEIQVPAIQLTEFRSWNEVAQLFASHYADTDLPEQLSAEIDRIAREYPEIADRAAEWLRFVQRQLRYFALSLGAGGLIPRPLETIWSSRFGDCKDATRLFVAGARQLGIDACAALVSTSHGLVLSDFLPSPSAFNHCIARLRLDDQTYWLDPTMARQEGRLHAIYQPHAGWALPLMPNATLERMNDHQPVHYRHTEGQLLIGSKLDTAAVFKLRIDLFSFAADALRQRIENEGSSKYSEQVISELRTTWPDIVETVPISMQDERADNRLTATFTYEIGNGWKAVGKKGRVGFQLAANSIAAELNPLKKTQRRTDVILGPPRKSTWRVRMHMPRQWAGAGWNEILNPTNLRYVNELAMGTQTILHTKEIVISDWTLPAAEASAYQDLVGKSRTNVTTVFARVFLGRIYPATSGPFGLSRRHWLRWVWIVLWSGCLAYVFLRPAPQ